MFEDTEHKAGKGALGLVILGPLFGLLYVCFLPLIALMTLLLALPELAVAKKAEIVDNAGACMSCHSSREFSKTFKNKEKMSVFVNADDFKGTVHAFLSCTDCHQKVSLNAHPGRSSYDSREAFLLAASAACRNCHSDTQLKAKPVHAFLTNKTNGPPCIDCHGSHSVKRSTAWKNTLSDNQYCLTCHSQKLTKTLGNGEKISLFIDPSPLKASVHGKHACTDCHTGFSRTSHPTRDFSDKRSRSFVIAEACKRCHLDKHNAVRESIHFKLISEGNSKAPVCTDCHGFHNVGPKATYETLSGVPCKGCHEEVFKRYQKSVHGMAKAKGHTGAPLCSSCHFAHEVKISAMNERIKTACLGCHKEAEAKHEKWLPNAGLHLSAVACSACHSPNTAKGIQLRLYDQNTDKPFTEEQAAKLLGSEYQAILQRISSHGGEGLESDELWDIVRKLNNKGTNAKVTFLGRMDVSNSAEAHQLALKKDAVRECEQCHTSESDFFKSVTVAVVKADGRLRNFKAKPEVLGSVFSMVSLKQFYVLGSTRLKALDWIGILMVFGGLSMPLAHIALRVLTSPIREAKRLNKMRKEGKR